VHAEAQHFTALELTRLLTARALLTNPSQSPNPLRPLPTPDLLTRQPSQTSDLGVPASSDPTPNTLTRPSPLQQQQQQQQQQPPASLLSPRFSTSVYARGAESPGRDWMATWHAAMHQHLMGISPALGVQVCGLRVNVTGRAGLALTGRVGQLGLAS